RSGLPLQQTAAVVQLSDGIDVRHELVLARKRPDKLELQVAAGLTNADAIVLAEAIEQLNALLEHAVPGIPMRVLELLIVAELPFLKQHSRRAESRRPKRVQRRARRAWMLGCLSP